MMNAYRENLLRILSSLLSLFLAILCAGVPSVESSALMYGTQSAKTIVFLAGVLVFSIPALLIILLKGKHQQIQLHYIDSLLFFFLIFVLLRNDFQEIKNSLLFLELTGLSVFYLVVRFSDRKTWMLVLTGLTAGGFMQALWGNLQLWGLLPSNHVLFKITGSFFNPGPYAGYLAAVFPVALGFYLFSGKSCESPNMKKERYLSTKALKYFSLLTLFFLLLALPASGSRAAWLAVLISSFYLLYIRYQLHIHSFIRLKKTILIIFPLIVFIGITLAFYQIRKGSADGRWLIWRISTKMIRDKPLAGQGYDGFKHSYMNYQAAYFQNHRESSGLMVAGDTKYAFNEVIQLTAENGVAGFLVIMVILYFIFTHRKKMEGPKGQKKLPDPNTPADFNREKNKLYHLSRALILSVLIFSLFSYPAQILPIKLCLTCGIAIFTAGITRKESVGIFSIRRVFRILVFLAGLTFLSWLTSQVLLLKANYKYWKSGYQLYSYRMYEECLSDYRKAYPFLKYNGDFLTNYGKALSMAERHEEAIEVLQKAGRYYPNTVVFTSLGDSYQKLGLVKDAEVAYLHAWQMNPGRFYPGYLLAKLYDDTGQKDKAARIAAELLSKDIKIESMAIEEIKREMIKILNNK